MLTEKVEIDSFLGVVGMYFSVVVPIYNVKNYLDECIEGIIRQSFKGYEIILVDDGSTDGSSEACDEWKNKYDSIKVIHKSNGGLSDARNVGASQAEGEYLVFLDSDDYWNDEFFLEKIHDMTHMSNLDLVVFGYKKVLDEKELSIYTPQSESKTIEELVLAGEFNICAWDKVVRRDLISSNNIAFRKGVFSEDMEWCSLLYKYVENVAVLPAAPHSYRQRNGSITKRISEKNISDVVYNFKRCLEIKKELSQEKSAIFDYYLSKNISMFMLALSQVDRVSQKKYYTFVKDNIAYLKTNTRNREKVMYLAAKILGVSITEKLLAYAFGVKK